MRQLPIIDNVFDVIATGNELRSTEANELHERGFVVLPGPMSAGSLERVSSAYDAIVASANADDVHTGSTTTRVTDFVNRGDETRARLGPLAQYVLGL